MGKAADEVADAARAGDVDGVREKLESGLDPDAVGAPPRGTEWRYDTPLKIAARSGHADVVELLLAAGANPEFASRGERETALALPIREGQADVVETLLDGGADPNATTGVFSYTPLMVAEESAKKHDPALWDKLRDLEVTLGLRKAKKTG